MKMQQFLQNLSVRMTKTEESAPVGPSTNDNVDDHQTNKQTTTAAEERASDYPEGAEGTFPFISVIFFRFYPNNTHLFVKNLK